MSKVSHRTLGIYPMFVTAMILSVGAGYWFGLVRHEAPNGDKVREIPVRADVDRSLEAEAPLLTPVKLVQESVSGSNDERQQWRNIRWLSEVEVKAAIEELGNADSYFVRGSSLREMLYYRWGELDPVAANAAARANFPKKFSSVRKAVIAAWIKHEGGVPVWDASMSEGGSWDCTRSLSGEVADMLVASLSDRDDVAAFKEVLRLDDENCMVADLLCRARAKKAAATPESRAAFLDAASTHPEPYVLDCAYEFLFREWAKMDIEAARAGALTMKISEKRKPRVQSGIDGVARDNQEEAERDAAESR